MNYFDGQAQGTPTAAGRFAKVADAPFFEMVPGVTLRPILGEEAMLSFVDLEPHAIAPMHAHVEEQLVIVLEGSMDFTIGEETRTMVPGDVALVPPWVRHGAQAGPAGCREVDIFTPPRRALLAALEPEDTD